MLHAKAPNVLETAGGWAAVGVFVSWFVGKKL